MNNTNIYWREKMNLISTRNSGESIPAIEAVLKGISRDGGLFVPIDLTRSGRIRDLLTK